MSFPRAMTEISLKKLTVPQLKQLCKEMRLTGYSKIAKDALVQKLLNWQNTQKSNTSSTTPTQDHPVTEVASVQVIGDIQANSTGYTPPLVPSNSFAIPAVPTVVKPHASATPASAPKSSTSLKRLPIDREETPSTQKKSKTIADTRNARNGIISDRTRRPGGSLVDNPLIANSSLPRSHLVSHSSKPAGKVDPQTAANPPSRPFKVPFKAPFKALVLVGKETSLPASTTAVSRPGASSARIPRGGLPDLEIYQDDSAITLRSISMPPTLAHRKRIPTMALILSEIAPQDLKACSLVSRAFRYAAYSSAANQLSKKFAGKRLEAIIRRHPLQTTDFWPYLLHRQDEARSRRKTFEASFLYQAMNGTCRIADNLWTSPDREKQAFIAIRFLLTKLFFSISVGYQSRGPSLSEVILDAQIVIADELWKITIQSQTSTYDIFVLEATCEVVGQASADSIQNMNSSDGAANVRADWSAYIHRKCDFPYTTVFDHLHWTNHEEYDRGISKLWLSTVAKDRKTGPAKLTVARRYILACLVANSISGKWLSSTAMQQDFDGLPFRPGAGNDKKGPKLNLFLPAHHHIESVHFESTRNIPLHSAVAVVQTPGREYYILRDNGMQIGCEEEGVALVWMDMLGCETNGCPVADRRDGK